MTKTSEDPYQKSPKFASFLCLNNSFCLQRSPGAFEKRFGLLVGREREIKLTVTLVSGRFTYSLSNPHCQVCGSL